MASPLPTPTAATRPKGAKTTRYSLGAFALSLLIHGLVILTVGGYVIIEGVLPKTTFTDSEGAVSGLDSEVIPAPEEPRDTMELPSSPTSELTPANSTPAPGESTSSDLIVSTAAQSAFTLPPAVGTPGVNPKLGFGSGYKGTTGGQENTGPRGSVIHSIFGSTEASATTLKGTMFDLKQNADKKPVNADYFKVLTRFITGGFDHSLMEEYFKVPQPLYTSHILIPNMDAAEGPKAFGVDDIVKPRMWFIHYTGQIRPPKSQKYRFCGGGDDVMVVALDGKIVMDGTLGNLNPSGWQPADPAASKESTGQLGTGDWLELSSDKNYRIDIVIGERPGGRFHAELLVQPEKVMSSKDRVAGDRRVLYVFSTLPVDFTASFKGTVLAGEPLVMTPK